MNDIGRVSLTLQKRIVCEAFFVLETGFNSDGYTPRQGGHEFGQAAFVGLSEEGGRGYRA